MSSLTRFSESWKEQAVRDTLQRHSWMPGIESVAENLEHKLENPDFEELVEKTKDYVDTTEPFKTVKTPGPIKAIFGALALGSAALYGIELNKDEDSLNEDVSKFFATVDDGTIEDTYWEQYCVDDPADLCGIKYTEWDPPETCLVNGESEYLTLNSLIGSENQLIIGKPNCDNAGYEIIHRSDETQMTRTPIDIDFEIFNLGIFTPSIIETDRIAIKDNRLHIVDENNYYVINMNGAIMSNTSHNFENSELSGNIHKLFSNKDDTYLYLKTGLESWGNLETKIYRWDGNSFEEKINLDYPLQTVIGNFQNGNSNNYAIAVDNQSQIVKLDFNTNEVIETDLYLPSQSEYAQFSIAGKGEGNSVAFYSLIGEHSTSYSIVKYDPITDKAHASLGGIHYTFGEPTIENVKKHGTYGSVLDFGWTNSPSSGYKIIGPSKYTVDDDYPTVPRLGVEELEPQGWTEIQKTPIDEESQNQNNNSNGESNGNGGEEIEDNNDYQQLYDDGYFDFVLDNENYLDVLDRDVDLNAMKRVFDVALTGENYVEGFLFFTIRGEEFESPDELTASVKFRDEHGNFYYSEPEKQFGNSVGTEFAGGFIRIPYSLKTDPQWLTAAMNFVMGGGDIVGAYSSFLEDRPDIYLDGIILNGKEVDIVDEKLTTSYDKLNEPDLSRREYRQIYIASPVDAKFYDNGELIETSRGWEDDLSPIIYLTYPEGGPTSKFAFIERGKADTMRLSPDETGGGEYRLIIKNFNKGSYLGDEQLYLDITQELIEGEYYELGTHEFEFEELREQYIEKFNEDKSSQNENSLDLDQPDWLIGSAIAAPILLGSGYGLYRRRKNKVNSIKNSLEETVNSLPPLPPEMAQFMKPQGWTNEQWEMYGADYMSRRLPHDEER